MSTNKNNKLLIIKEFIGFIFGLILIIITKLLDLIPQDIINLQFLLIALFVILLHLIIILITNFYQNKDLAKKIIWIVLVFDIAFFSFVIIHFQPKKVEPFPDDQFGIVVAEFEEKRLKKPENKLKDTIIRELEYKYDTDIKRKKIGIKGYSKIIKDDYDIIINNIGEETNASLIIFGSVLEVENKAIIDSYLAIKDKSLRPELKDSLIHIYDKTNYIDQDNYIEIKLPQLLIKNLDVLYKLSCMFIKLNKSDFDSAKTIVENLSGEIGNTLKHHFLGIIYFNQAFRDTSINRNREKKFSTLDSAKAEFKKSIQIDTTYHNSYFSLGQLFKARFDKLHDGPDNLDSAAVYFEKAYHLESKNSKYIINLSNAYLDATWYTDVISLTDSVKNSAVFESLNKPNQKILEENKSKAQNALKGKTNEYP